MAIVRFKFIPMKMYGMQSSGRERKSGVYNDENSISQNSEIGMNTA